MKCGPKEDFFVVDNDPQGYKLSCCGSFGLGFFQIALVILSTISDFQKWSSPSSLVERENLDCFPHYIQ